MASRSRRRAAAPAFPALSIGVQNGIIRIIADNKKTIVDMLDAQENDDLKEKCAKVMKQQQLSASQFLARFFTEDILRAHVILFNKSDKGSSAQLAERIGKEWAKSTPFVEPKRKQTESDGEDEPVKKNKKQKVKEKKADEKVNDA